MTAALYKQGVGVSGNNDLAKRSGTRWLYVIPLAEVLVVSVEDTTRQAGTRLSVVVLVQPVATQLFIM